MRIAGETLRTTVDERDPLEASSDPTSHSDQTTEAQQRRHHRSEVLSAGLGDEVGCRSDKDTVRQTAQHLHTYITVIR
jgi:hypothetical protein